jgi:hypothetical protein
MLVTDLPASRLAEGVMFNRQSAIGNQESIDPSTVVRNQDR